VNKPALMRDRKCLRDLSGQCASAAWWNRTSRGHQLPEVRPFHKVHHQTDPVPVRHGVVHLYDAREVAISQDCCFVQKSGSHLGIVSELSPEYLHGSRGTGLKMTGTPHPACCAESDLLEQEVIT